jgi:hypothetical protein
MAYYIFLKSLRSLEEFRKNPHVKIPPKSPYANFQSLGVFKNQFLFGKEFSPSLSAHPAFRPNLLFSFTRDFPPLPPLGHGLPASIAHRTAPPAGTAHRTPSSSSRTDAGGAPLAASPVAPTLPPEEKNGRIYFTLLIGAIPTLFNPGNWRLQPHH